MDNRGYIFSTDAVLALVIFFVMAGSILTYYTLPSYLGADHQHLEAEADSALALLTNDGDLHAAILKINSNDTKKQEEGKQLLNDKLRLILPSDVAYDLEVSGVSISDNKGISDPNDRVSRYTVISAPEEGWLGRAWYKMEDVQFKKEYVNTTQTLWNFHNFLRGFEYWQGNSLGSNAGKYWGKPGTQNGGPIRFTIPDGADLKGAYYIVGCQGSTKKLNGYVYNITQFNGTQTGLVEGTWQQDSRTNNWQNWHPANGDWNDDHTVWINDGFYLFPGLLSGPASNKRESNMPVKGTATQLTVNENNHPELNARPSFGVRLYLNNREAGFGNISGYPNSSFTYLFRRDNDASKAALYNGKGDVDSSSLKPGEVNDFYMEFIGANTEQNMPWFSLLGEYSMSLIVPEGINTDRFPKDYESKNYYCAGIATKNMFITYDLNTGEIKKNNTKRELKLKDYRGKDFIKGGVNYADGIPFRLDPTGTKGVNNKDIKDGCAVSKEYPIDLTEKGNDKINSKNIRIVDAYAVINTYGATDKVLVEVYNGSDWHEIFDSLKNTKVESGGGGYGNVPGTVYIPKEYLSPNEVNKLRVTVWDDAGNSGYDLVGLVDTYAVVSFTSLPIKWETFPFVSQQSPTNWDSSTPNNQTLSQTQMVTMGADPDASKVMFFFGVGLDTKHVKLEVSKDNSTWKTLYDDDEIPFALDIGDLDVANDSLFTKGSVGNYSTIEGVYYTRLTVDVGEGWKSGDEQVGDNNNYRKRYASAACEIFSGSRVAVIYPKFLSNEWSTAYADTPDKAKQEAIRRLINELNSTIDPNLINTEALYAGDMPNTVPIRLDLWRS